MSWTPAGDDFRSEAMTTVLDEMHRDNQPQRALHNWLKDFVDMVGDCTTYMPSGKIKKYAPAEVVSWIRQFCDIYEEVAAEQVEESQANAQQLQGEICSDCGMWGELHKIIPSKKVNYCGNCGRKLSPVR